MKNKLISVLVFAGFIATPLVASADSQIGTWAYSLSQGAPNIYYQGKINEKSAWLVDVGTTSGATAVFGYYKGYITDYANGPFWKAGGAYASFNGSSGGAASVALGYEATVADKFVIGAFLAGFAGSGGNSTGWDISLGYKF